MLPGTVLYVSGADVFKTFGKEGKIPWSLIVVFIVALIIVTLLVRHAKRTLAKKQNMEKNHE